MTHKYKFGYSTIPKEKWDMVFGRKKVESGVVTDMGEDYITFEGPPWCVTGEAIEEYKKKKDETNKACNRVAEINKDIREFNKENKGNEQPEIEVSPNKVSDFDEFCHRFGAR